jgi:hypothetical protein
MRVLHTWSDNKVRELIAASATYLIAEYRCGHIQVLPLGSYGLILAPSPPFKTILELVLWNGLQSCSHIIPDVNNAIKRPPYLRQQKK